MGINSDRFNITASTDPVLEGEAVIITRAMLQGNAEDVDEAIYRVSSLPTEGELRLNNQSLAVNGTFTQADIDSGKLSYLHSGSETTSDRFSFATLERFTARISVDANGDQANDNSGTAVSGISADGRFITFASVATNLVGDDTNQKRDVFVFDRQTGEIERVSIASNGSQSDGTSDGASISADGRYVAFFSEANNLVEGDTNNKPDIFVFDRETRQTTRVSIDSSGNQGDDGSYGTAISEDGQLIAYSSFATNLVQNDTNGQRDAFLYDRETRKTIRTSIGLNGNESNNVSRLPWISGNGRYFAFQSDANNLVIDDTNSKTDVFVFDRETAQTSIVSVDSEGAIGNSNSSNPATSANGRFVVFESNSSNLGSNDANGKFDIFLHDRETRETIAISINASGEFGNADSRNASISADGRYITFDSEASNLVDGDTGNKDVFVYDRSTGQIQRVSQDGRGSTTNVGSSDPAISADGQYITFYSDANNLVDGDTNNFVDAFIYGPKVTNVSIAVTATNDAPILNQAIVNQTATEETAFSFTLLLNTFSDAEGDALSYTASLENDDPLPIWLSFNALTQTFSGTPDDRDLAPLRLKVTSSDPSSASGFGVFQLAIAAVNDAPILPSDLDRTVNEDEPFGFAVAAAIDPDDRAGTEPLTYSATLANGDPLPNWVRFDAATRTFSGTATNSNVGAIDIEIAVSDGQASDRQIFTLSIANANDAPTVVRAVATQGAIEDTAFRFTIPIDTFADVDAADSLSYTATLENGNRLPSWLSFDAATRTFSGTPTNGDVGSLAVKATAIDRSNAFVSNLFALTVANTNDAPTLASAIASQTAIEDRAFTFIVPVSTFSDVDAGDLLTYTTTLANGDPLPSWLSFDAATRTLSGTPLNSQVGSLSLKATAADRAGRTASSEFNLTIANTNDAPMLNRAIADQTATEAAAFSFTVAADAFGDVDAGDRLTYTATLENGNSLPQWLSFNASTRTFSGLPPQASAGRLSIKTIATDRAGATASDVFQVSIADDTNLGSGGTTGGGTTGGNQGGAGTLPAPTLPQPLMGTTQADGLQGSSNADVILGLEGNDMLVGGEGDDRLTGGPGKDTLSGGGGADRFIYSGATQAMALRESTLKAYDRISDFSVTVGDRIQLDFDDNLSSSELPRGLFNAGRQKTRSLSDAVRAAFQDKNRQRRGDQALRSNEAVILNWKGQTFLGVNDARASFSARHDLVIDVTKIESIGSAGSLNVETYFA